MTVRDKAIKRAEKLKSAMDKEASAQVFGSTQQFLTEIRAFLQGNEQQEQANNVIALLRSTENNDLFAIELGPQIDKVATDKHYRFDSGARLSFGITLRKTSRKKTSLLTYRFHYVFKDGHSPSFIRFDLNSDSKDSTLEEARCHIHPGLKDTRLPARVLSPIEVLDRIFFVLDQCSCSICA